MKTTIDLPDEFMKRVKIRASLQGKEPGDPLAEIAMNAFDSSPPDRTLRYHSGSPQRL